MVIDSQQNRRRCEKLSKSQSNPKKPKKYSKNTTQIINSKSQHKISNHNKRKERERARELHSKRGEVAGSSY